ncbi:metalloregulator ArsR/SmtB family transcription factor [Pullulanibacillus sp. KACC 23026]|uniref:ArsR/SmtB family transcription factor n=1 Tax=Pullulanibacillus sp. KACC 23026 TaxID=3028315 RepID=UPI0023B11521|nr:metalloregulator ArsR/SmtB family transcription factor [Pullulanibacillus sp. KACC 23026]WEG12108.1 metalloregulator ArsR/SmtB family transcription factor [Pullulanibacillus sp. KACC 23026]
MDKKEIKMEKAVSILKLLGDKTRLTIVALLSQTNECCVCEFVDLFNMTQPAISQHLRKLREAGIVTEKKKGQWVFYSLNKNQEAYALIHSLLEHVPNQKEKLNELEVKGSRMSCC